MTFGTFDVFHRGHEHYLNEAKKYGDHLITVIARDATVERIKGEIPRNHERARLRKVDESKIADEVILGEKDNPYQVLLNYRPDVLCFGYDQRSFNDERLEKFLQENGLNPEIIVLDPFEPDTYKSSKM